MNNGRCAICLKEIDVDNSSILVMGGFGNPRCVCEACDANIDAATRATDPTEISAAVKRIVDNMSANGIEDPPTVRTVTSLLAKAASRRESIKEGTYDFALDDADDGALEEIPEDMLETEEDRRLDEEDKARAEKLDKAMNWVWIVAIVAMVGFMIWWFFFR